MMRSLTQQKTTVRSCPRNQRGMGSLNLLVCICFGVMLLVGVLKVLPVFMENRKIQAVLQDVADEYSQGGAAPSKNILVSKIAKRFSIEDIRSLPVSDIDIERQDKVWVVDAGYEKRVELFKNIALVIDFTETNRYRLVPGATN